MKQTQKRYRRIVLFCLISVLTGLCITATACKKKTDTVGKTIAKADDLEGARIGVQLGTTGDIYASDVEDAKVVQYNKGADAIMALKQNKLDCVIIDELPAKAFVEVNNDLSILKEEFVVEEYAGCIAKNNTELKEKINEALTTLKENGTLEQIEKNYIGDDTKGKYPYYSPDGIVRNNGTLVVATNAEFEPYEYMENGEIVGYDIDMARAICDELRMELVVENIEFASIINAVQSGKADIGLSGMTVTEDRLKTVDFTQSYTTATQVIIVRNGEKAEQASLKDKLYLNFVKENRWKNLTTGLGNTLLISFFALLLGAVLGFVIAVVRSSCDMTGKAKLINLLLKCYVTIIRGTPAMIQLLIIYYVIFATSNVNKVVVAAIAFGINSSAYVAEIVRGGIMAVDKGQFEAGRSIGFNYTQTMWYFILPQALRSVLPALGNEFIVLVKETSISGYIGIMDLTKGGDLIRSRTYEAFLPLITVAIIYLVIVMVLSNLVGRMERRLCTDERK